MFTIGKHVFVECWATYKHTWDIGSKAMEPKSHPSQDFENVLAYWRRPWAADPLLNSCKSYMIALKQCWQILHSWKMFGAFTSWPALLRICEPPNKRSYEKIWLEKPALVSVVVHCGFGRACAVKTNEGRDEGGSNSVGAWHTWFSSLWATCGDQTLTVGRGK